MAAWPSEDAWMTFEGKAALVTGGGRGIGKAIALELARRGANVAFNYLRSHDDALKTQQEIEALGVRCLRLKAHLADPARIRAMFAEIAAAFGSLDVLVNNAASGVNRPAAELDEKHWDWTHNVNARGAWLCSMEAAKLMHSGGSIVNISSMGSQRVLPDYFLVGTSKAALETLTRYLAVELAPRNVSVNAVSPGYVLTGALAHFPNREEMIAQAEARTPAGRLLKPEDVARVVAFLCTPDAHMIRGQVIAIDGGATLTATP